MKRQKIATVLAWLLMFILPLPLIMLLNQGLIETATNLVIYDLGIAAYVWWLALVVIATRPKWLEQLIGLPTLYSIHGVIGIVALVAATLHKFNSFSMFPLIKETGNYAWYLMLFVIGYAVLFMSGWLVDRNKLFSNLKRFLEEKLLKHQVSVWLHRLVFIAIGLVWVHVMLIPRLGNVAGFRSVFNLYTLVALGWYIVYKLNQKFGQADAIVSENHSLSADLQQVVLKLKDPQKQYRAGDFYFLAFKSNFKISGEAHPFSVASAPTVDPNEVVFMIHKLGDFTKRIETIPVGTKVKLEGPFGLFDRYVKEAKGPVILYGLGTGVAPLFSLAIQYAGQKSIRLIWSTNGQEPGAYYTEQLEQLAKQGVAVNVKAHRFVAGELQQILSQAEVQNGLVITVGSASVVLKVQQTLRDIGFSSTQLLDERITM